jgi:poly(3-hydroxyalkanoate) synthetase
MQSRQDVVQQFDRGLSGGGVIAPSDHKGPATTPSSVTELFDLQRRSFKQSWWPDCDRGLKERSSGTKAGPAKLGSKKDKPIEPPPGCYVKSRAV